MSDNNVNTTDPFEFWAVVELMGHAKTAGKISEEMHAGVMLLRVDVPESDKRAAGTKFYGGNAIYSITPCDKDVALAYLEQTWTDPLIVVRMPKPERALEQPPDLSEDDEDDNVDCIVDALNKRDQEHDS